MRLLLLLTLAGPLLAQEASNPPDGMAEFKALQTEHRAATQKFYKDFQEARKKNPNLRYDFSKHPDRAYIAKYNELAKEFAGTEGAANCLVEVARLGRTTPMAKAAIATLLEHHIGSASLKSLAWTLRLIGDTKSLDVLLEKSPHADVQGFALFSLAQITKRDNEKKALAMFLQVKEKYGDVSYFGRATLGQKAEGEIYEVTYLVVGKKAPDIVGEDLDGKPMRLSDFRGKIVFLDFWGDW